MKYKTISLHVLDLRLASRPKFCPRPHKIGLGLDFDLLASALKKDQKFGIIWLRGQSFGGLALLGLDTKVLALPRPRRQNFGISLVALVSSRTSENVDP